MPSTKPACVEFVAPMKAKMKQIATSLSHAFHPRLNVVSHAFLRIVAKSHDIGSPLI